LAMVTIASPYCIWVLKQASDKLPYELDEAARMDGATPLQLFWMVYLPLMVPSLVAVGTYALLLAWNEYLCSGWHLRASLGLERIPLRILTFIQR